MLYLSYNLLLAFRISGVPPLETVPYGKYTSDNYIMLKIFLQLSPLTKIFHFFRYSPHIHAADGHISVANMTADCL